MTSTAAAFETRAAISVPDELLAPARQLIDASSADAYADPEIDVSCTAGCGACCSQSVPVTAAEVRSIHAYLDGLDPDVQTSFRERITHAADTLAAEGITATHSPDPDAYFRLNVACPFLVDGSCGIRPVRPLVCREYLVVSDPAHCGSGDFEQVVRIRSQRDVRAGFVRVAAAFDEDERLVLAPAMALPIPEMAASAPKSGPVMTQMLATTRLQSASSSQPTS